MTMLQLEQNTKSICLHKLHDQVTCSHEVICKKCGTVLGIDNTEEIDSKSIINLFQEIQPGCKPVRLEATARIHDQKFASSVFSNACDKLSLPRHVALDAWHIFTKLIKCEQSRKTSLTYGAIAVFALFVSCRRFGISKSDSQIKSVIKLCFSIKHLPTLLKIFTTLKPIALVLGIKIDDVHLEYYINVYLRKYNNQKFLPIDIRQQIRNLAFLLPGTDEAKARNAVKIILAGLGN